MTQHTIFNTQTLNPLSPCVWSGHVAELPRGDDDSAVAAWLAACAATFTTLTGYRPGPQQIEAWRDSVAVLWRCFADLAPQRPACADWFLVVEYLLPREGGRRIDVVLLAEGQIVVFEFKQDTRATLAALDQVAAYARDLSLYHAASHDRPVHALLVPTRAMSLHDQREGVQVCSPDQLASWLASLAHGPALDAVSWLAADYLPLPGIVQAARQLFAHEPLPHIRRAHSAGIPQVLALIDSVIERARTYSERHVVLLVGVPGAGKTLVGLQTVYAHAGDGPRPDAVVLSGNGMLVAVLQYALRNRVFVQEIRNFFQHYRLRPQAAPPEHVVVFDEAQRAWDTERMQEKHLVQQNAQEHVLALAERVPDWVVVLALIGEGQEIHLGEEGGMPQWNAALHTTSAHWKVHCSSRLAQQFDGDVALQIDDLFDLSTTLRSHLAADLHAWVAALLDGKIDHAATVAEAVRAQGFALYFSRDLDVAKAYCRTRYADSPDKRYGLVASSRAGNLPRFGVANDYQTTRRLRVGPWHIDPPDTLRSCCALADVATEFACQGLELDLPLVCWGSDLVWDGEDWRSPAQPRSKARDPHRLRVNSYRVLLTRGRDGMVVFVPPEPRMDATAAVLQRAGMLMLGK